MWTRNLVIVVCCLASSPVLAAVDNMSGGAEVIPTPAANPYPPMAGPVSGGVVCEGVPGTPPSAPWYYWWSSWHWFDKCHDRGQHYAYLPPLPGWYYFRPYSVGQLRAQQEAVMQWGGDPRNPYCGVLPPQNGRHRDISVSSTARASRGTSLEVVRTPVTPAASPVVAASYSMPAAAPATRVADASASVIPWPPVLRGPRFAAQRARIETPFRRNASSQAAPSVAEYQDMIDAAEQMKAVLWQMNAEILPQEGQDAERFLDQLAAEARGQVNPSEGSNRFVSGR